MKNLIITSLGLLLASTLCAQQENTTPVEENKYTYNEDQLLTRKTTTRASASGEITENIVTEYVYYNKKLANEKITTIRLADSQKTVEQHQYNPSSGTLKVSTKEIYELVKGVYRIIFKRMEDFWEQKLMTVSVYTYDKSGLAMIEEKYEYDLLDAGKKSLSIYTKTGSMIKNGNNFIQEIRGCTYLYDENDLVYQIRVSIDDIDDNISFTRYYLLNPDATLKEVQFQGKDAKISKPEQEEELAELLKLMEMTFSY